MAFVAVRSGRSSLRVVPAALPAGEYEPRRPPKLDGAPDALDRFRADALSRAKVWRAPPGPLASVDLARNVDEAFGTDDVVSCRYLFDDSTGWTPKFDCVVAGGEVLRVKYGAANAEVFAETVATRLLSALGFGADRVYVVRAVRCFGCPPAPYPRWGEWWNRLLQARGGYREFVPAVVERPLGGTPVAGSDRRGWSWHELEVIDPARGGATRAERDAFRLMAVFLAHWDNKSENQRLVCLDEPKTLEDGCARPFALIQDAGSTFGPRRLDLRAWRDAPIWSDVGRCRVDMASMPFLGGTFPEAEISEGGRRFLAERLGALSRAQVRALFAGARLDSLTDLPVEDRDPDRWADAFDYRVQQIAEAGRCPVS